jgi:flagellar motor protein MotB
MARSPAWDSQIDLNSLGVRRSRGGGWKTVLVLLGLIGAGTFVLGYYLPLHRAHAALTAQHQALSGKAQSAAAALKNAQTELSTTKDKRDELERAQHEIQTAKTKDMAKLELVKTSLGTKLEKLTSKGQAAITLSDNRLFVSLAESMLFAGQKPEVSARGKSVLCDIAKSTAQNPLRVSSVVGTEASLGDESVWGYTAAHAAGVAQALQEGCGVTTSRLLATGVGGNQAASGPKGMTAKLPARIDIEILP